MNEDKVLAAAKNYAASLQAVKVTESYRNDMAERWHDADAALERAQETMAQAVKQLQDALNE